MTNDEATPNRKEIFSGSIVMFIGLFYLYSLVSAFVQTRGAGNISGIMQFKWLFTGVVFLSGAIAMFRMKTAGWFITAATLLLYTMLMVLHISRIIVQGEFNRYIIFPLLFLVVLIMGLSFLFAKETRVRFGVNNKTYLLTIGLYLVLVFVHYVL